MKLKSTQTPPEARSPATGGGWLVGRGAGLFVALGIITRHPLWVVGKLTVYRSEISPPRYVPRLCTLLGGRYLDLGGRRLG